MPKEDLGAEYIALMTTEAQNDNPILNAKCAVETGILIPTKQSYSKAGIFYLDRITMANLLEPALLSSIRSCYFCAFVAQAVLIVLRWVLLPGLSNSNP